MIKRIKNTTKKARAIIDTFNSNYWNRGTIWEAYQKPSSTKVRAYEEILRRALDTEGYNHDLRITGASCHFFSTMYSYTDSEGTHIVYDTPSNVVEVLL